MRLSSRKYQKALPWNSFVPLLVRMFTTPPVALPNSAEYESVTTWNSRMASWLKVARTAPTITSLLSSPSTMMLLERARWPVKERPEVAEAPCCGVRSVVTPGVMIEKLMKLRPLIGRFSICCWPTTEETDVSVASTIGDSPTIVSSSWVPAIFRVNSSSTVCPSWRVTPSRVWLAKPWTLAVTLYVPGGRAGTLYSPCASLVAVRVRLVSRFTTVTVAAGRTAIDSSVTRPTRSAPVSRAWARTGGTAARAMAKPTARQRKAARDIGETSAGKDRWPPIVETVEPNHTRGSRRVKCAWTGHGNDRGWDRAPSAANR